MENKASGGNLFTETEMSDVDQKRMHDEMKASSAQKVGMTRDKLMFGIPVEEVD